jgi:hypothetical protein
MYFLFKLVTRSAYWQILFRRTTWSEAWVQISRFHKDKRARRYTLGIAALLTAPLILLVYLGWVIGSGGVLLVPFVIPVLWWRSRRERENAPLHIVQPSAPLVIALSDEAARELLTYFRDLTLVYAVTINRANSEAFLKQKELPEGVEVISRRVLLDMLRSRRLWDRISSYDREAMMIADGHWDWETINHAVSKTEELRLLRWLLGVDPYLPAVGQQLDMPARLAFDITNAPEKLLKTKLRDLSDLRIAQNTANVYFLRCIAEGVSRGIFAAPTEEIRTWATEASDTLGGDHNEDLLLGRELVSEADDDLLMRGFERSRQRDNFLKWLISIFETGVVPDSILPVLYSPQVQPIPPDDRPSPPSPLLPPTAE